MIRRTLTLSLSVMTVSLWMGCTKQSIDKSTDQLQSSSSQSPTLASAGYWTCTMHPQVHLDGPGKCPICGMPLVHVENHQKIEQKEAEGIQASNTQLQNAQISKYTVAKKDLEITISASGRLLSSREVVFQIYESDLSSVKPGQEFQGSPAGNPSQILKGRITRVDNLVDPSSRTVQATGVLQHTVSSQTAESGFHGEITNVLKNQLVVPEESVLHTGTRELVYVFTSSNKLEPRAVQLGQKGRNGFQILSGLKEGEVISSGPNFLIDSEAKLRSQ